MQSIKSRKVLVSLILLFASALILCAVNPAPILLLYKVIYVKYVRITKTEFVRRFNDAELNAAIMHARNQDWVQKQIQNDLAPFKKGIKPADVDRAYRIFQDISHNKLAKFTVEDNKVTVDVPLQLASLRAYKTVHSVIELLASKGLIPNCKFIVALNDYLSFIPEDATSAPIFTFAKHSQIPIEKDTILIPDWMNVRYWDVLRGRISLANKLYPWHRKKNIIYWRGGTADSMNHRTQLMNLKPKLKFIDVGMTEGPNRVPHVDPETSLQFKYQLAMDGARCTWERMVWQMSSNSIMIKPDSPQVQWFYSALEPYVNYVPVKNIDAINIAAVYDWLQTNDDKVREISQNANEFARNNFKTQDFFAYYAVLFQEYAKLYK